ncbi:MAG: uroporphyrinogen decarboxylase family protein [Lentisphaeria bacterium]
MDKRQLVRDAIAHRPTARVPYCIRFCEEGGLATVRGLAPAGTDPYAYVDNDVELVFPPWWDWHDLGADWQGMEAPRSPARVRGTGSYPAFFDEVKRVHDTTGRYVLATIYGSHWEKAYFSRGIENFLADLAGEPEFARRLLTAIIDKNLVMLENFLAHSEIDGVLLGSDWGTQQDLIMSTATWEEMIRPGEQREYDLVHGYGKHVWVHSCGKIDKILPALVEMGVDVLNPVQPECMDLAELKARYGAKLTFWGGISTQRTLPYGTPAEVCAETRRVRDLLARDGGYILSPSQEIQGDVPAANLQALLATARHG